MELFIIVYTGYEGIEKIEGVFDKDIATNVLKERRDSEKYQDEKDRWCIQRAELNGGEPECCCNEVGLPPSKLWLY